ncbi:MAG: transposase [Chloroflexi bacterium]|nr:transposase [Chloroflexota bacterium]
MGDGSDTKHFAVVTNDWETAGQALLEWHRGKAGTSAQVHRVLKDELGAGVYPSGKFGANAAWLRLQVLTHNLLELFKAAGLDPQYRQARPKRLRFAIFSQVGRVVRHAGERFLRVAQRVLEELVWRWRRRFRRLGWAPL